MLVEASKRGVVWRVVEERFGLKLRDSIMYVIGNPKQPSRVLTITSLHPSFVSIRCLSLSIDEFPSTPQ
jgi:hypothetical protein